MAKRRKRRRFTVELTCEMEIDDEVIAAVDDEWRSRFYDLRTPGEIASHIAFNLLVNGAELTHLDGWADKDDAMTEILRASVDVEASEIK